jgi:hypothetical protein
MAAYPSYSIGIGSSRNVENNYEDDISANGTMHSRLMHSRIYHRFSVVHPNLTGQEYSDLLTTYANNFRATMTGFTYHDESPAVSYSVQFLEPPKIAANLGSNRFDVMVSLRGWVA